MIQTTPTMSPSSAIYAAIGRWFRYSRVSDRNQSGIEDGVAPNPVDDRPDYGAYNEAFIVHHWASFGPRL